jgi:hypothetical protein
MLDWQEVGKFGKFVYYHQNAISYTYGRPSMKSIMIICYDSLGIGCDVPPLSKDG